MFTERQIEIMKAATARIDKFGIQSCTIKNLAADIGLSEPALYRHFESKNAILWGLLDFFSSEMRSRIEGVIQTGFTDAPEELTAIFKSQLKALVDNPAIVSVIFSESIFHFDETLKEKVGEVMQAMQVYISRNIEQGQQDGSYSRLIGASTLTTIVLGSMRLTVLKWKLSGHRSDLVKDGTSVVESIIKMMKTTKI